MKATFTTREALTDTIASFSFKTEQPFIYTAGQFIELSLPGHHEHGQTAKRWFTLSSSPHENELTITTRIGSAAHTPFKRALEKLNPGDTVDISEPLGDFVLPKLMQTPLVFIAGGIGITPFRSMFSWMKHADEQRDIHLFHAVRVEEDIIFQEVFEAVNQHETVIVEQPSSAWGGERGNITGEMIQGLSGFTDDTLIYLSGPEPFVQKLQQDLVALGVSRQQIVLDEFQGYSEV